MMPAATPLPTFFDPFLALAADAWRCGFHESNGGNLSVRLTPEDAQAARGMAMPDEYGPWVPLAKPVTAMGGEMLLVTGSGKHFRDIERDVAGTVGIIEFSPDGGSWRTVWGLEGARPTSELPSHALLHGLRIDDGSDQRVVYHAHPPAIAALSGLATFDARSLTRLLWKVFSESVVAFPEGVGFVGWLPPGSYELALASAGEMASCRVCVWQFHGVLATAATCSEAFGAVCAVEKAADIALRRMSACVGADAAGQGGMADAAALSGLMISDEGLRRVAEAYALPLRTDYLDE